MRSGRRILLYALMFALMFGFFEGVALLANLVLDGDEVYDHRDSTLSRLSQNGLAAFDARSGDPVLGWDNPPSQRLPDRDCTGVDLSQTIDARGARTYAGYDPAAVQIIAVGDSYTNSSGTADADTYPAQLASLLGVSVANHGVGGYGPVQSVLNLEQKLRHYPRARIVILGIMYENIYRMVNAYRPVLYDNAMDYGLKPWMEGGVIRPHPGKQALEDIGHFRRCATEAFDHDFWAKPKPEFPYFLNLLKSMGSRYFIYRKLQKQARKFGIPEYFLAFHSEDFLSELMPLLRHFSEFSAAHGLVPVVVFIPRNKYDTLSAGRMIEREPDRFPAKLLVGDVGDMNIDWEKFNIQDPRSNNICHPSALGYRWIAEYTAGLLLQNGLLPRRTQAGSVK